MDATRLFPMRSKIKWNKSVSDLRTVDRSCIELRLESKVTGIEAIDEFKSLRSLWCFNISENDFDNICKCRSLENLYIEQSKIADLGGLELLPNLKVLGLFNFSKISSLNQIGRLVQLEVLAVEGFNKVANIDALSRLVNLEELAVSGSVWTRMNIDSLQPISKLTKLRFLHLSNLKSRDESLLPLEQLTHLENLGLPNFYPMEEFARLAGKLTNVQCDWFSRFRELPESECRKCHKNRIVMLTGKGLRNLCLDCDAATMEKHLAKFDEISSS